MTILLDPAVKSETVQIEYMLEGKFGGFGSVIREDSGVSSYDIPAVVNGMPAEKIKFFVWAPGCRIALFDISFRDSQPVKRSYVCVPLGTTELVGKLPRELVNSNNRDVAVFYVANWACQFFGLKDCMVPMIALGTVRPDDEGAFRIELPDFSADPIASQSVGGGAEVQLQFQGSNTVLLQPQLVDFRTATHALKIAPRYPESLQFLALNSTDSRH
jgi:hypothetical protein